VNSHRYPHAADNVVGKELKLCFRNEVVIFQLLWYDFQALSACSCRFWTCDTASYSWCAFVY